MYRILSASKDTYITSKIIGGRRVEDANVGVASTVDVFKLYGETRMSGSQDHYELSRGLVQFDFSPILSLTSSYLGTSGSDFKAFLHLKNVNGGQMVPSNFNLEVHPLAKSWNEGIGNDVITFSNIDAANWLTASVSPLTLWEIPGAGLGGILGSGSCDYYVSGNIGNGVQSLSVVQHFDRGDEDLLVDVSHLVSASIWGGLPNLGFRVSFTSEQEDDHTTRFVKRFGSRNTKNATFRPNMIVKYNGNLVLDDTGFPVFDEQNRFYFYNSPRGIFENYKVGGQSITGSDCLSLNLIASKSYHHLTTSWSISHSASITYKTSSMIFYSASFPMNQTNFGGIPQPGSYYSDVLLDTFSDSSLNTFVSGSGKNGYEQDFQVVITTPDNLTTFTSDEYIRFKKIRTSTTSFDQRNYIVNITNLENHYNQSENTRLRVFIQDWEQDYSTKRLPAPAKSKIFKNMFWRVIDPYSKETIIPFDDIGTRLSSDGSGMYFDFWFSDLISNKVYEFEFMIKENGKQDFFLDHGFRFKVLNER